MKNLGLYIIGLVLLGVLMLRWFYKKNRPLNDHAGKIDEVLKQNIDWLEKRGYKRNLSFDSTQDGWAKDSMFIPYDALIGPDRQHGLDHETFTQRILEMEKGS